MKRYVRAEVLEEPVALPGDLVVAVVQTRDEERRHLGPDLGLALQPDERVEHGLEMREGDAVVELLGEPLQVDVGGVDVLEELRARLGRHVARRHEDVREPRRVCRAGDVDDELGPDDGIVVGIGDARATGTEGERDDLLGRRRLARVLVELRLADVPVLAELAPEIAARGAEGEHSLTRQEVVQGLLLDRVGGEARRLAVARAPELPAVVLADVAEARLSLADETVARAERAAKLVALRGVPPASRMQLGRHLLQDT